MNKTRTREDVLQDLAILKQKERPLQDIMNDINEVVKNQIKINDILDSINKLSIEIDEKERPRLCKLDTSFLIDEILKQE